MKELAGVLEEYLGEGASSKVVYGDGIAVDRIFIYPDRVPKRFLEIETIGGAR